MREYRFDVVRVVCMTYIVAYFHLYGYVYLQGQPPVSIAMAHACLGLFTFVSGYLLGSKYSFGQQGNSQIGLFYKKRILRIVPLFLIASLALWLIGLNDCIATLNGLLCLSPFVDPKPMTLYYIPIISWCYLVTPLISRHGMRWRIYSCLTFMGLLVIARFFFPSVDARFVFDVFFYFVGVVSGPCFDWKLNSPLGKVIKGVVVLTFAVLIVAAIPYSLLYSNSSQMTVGAIGVFAILFVCEGISKWLFENQETNSAKALVCRIIAIVSYASMACYLFHRLFYWVAESLWNPLDTSVKWLFMAGLVYAIIIFLSYMIQKLYDMIVMRPKWMLWSLMIVTVLGFVGYETHLFIAKEFKPAKERPSFFVVPHPDDDTLRVAVIGDSWAKFHNTFSCDTLLEQYAGQLTQMPIKCQSGGKGGALSGEVYCLMFNDFKPLLEAHPDYCVVMVGINDTWKKRPVSYYTGNYQLIIRLLLASDICPVVMEIPDFEMGEWLNENRKRQRFLYHIYSYFTNVVEDDITPFRNGLKDMLSKTGLIDSVLFIPASNWLPQDHNYSADIYQIDHIHLNYQGYHLLDSCIASEIINCNRKKD